VGPALADGLERAAGHRISAPSSDIAFYGGLFLPDGDEGYKSGTSDPFASLDDAELAELTDVLAELVTAEEIAAAARAEPKGCSRFPHALQVVMRAVDRTFGSSAAVLSVGVLRQVRRYLSDPEVRSAVDARVRTAVLTGCRS
jgi:hypothetical protein